MARKRLLIILGPVEITTQAYQGKSSPITSHIASEFIEIFGQTIERLLQIFHLKIGQVFILSGSRTLAMDSSTVNLLEPGDHVAVLSSGYFGDRMAEVYTRYQANVDIIASSAAIVIALSNYFPSFTPGVGVEAALMAYSR